MMIDGEALHPRRKRGLGVRIDRLRAELVRPQATSGRGASLPTMSPATVPAGDAGRRRCRVPDCATDCPRTVHADAMERAAAGRRLEQHRPLGPRAGGVAAAEQHLDPRLPAAVMALETQGIHERDGAVIEVWDNHPADGPSVGLMQVKPWVWQYLRAGGRRLSSRPATSALGVRRSSPT